MAARPVHLVITCEHGGNRIPRRYRAYFRGREKLLRTHRGYDAGALALARLFSRRLNAPLFAATTSRLLIDLNRSPGHRGLYSEATRAASAAERREMSARCYAPYRAAAEAAIAAAVAHRRRVVHVSCHSFTPELDGIVRDADVGLLYDPARRDEAEFCRQWRMALRELAPDLKVRRNYPYRGKDDGFTAWLRKRFPVDRYAGIEIEVNQKHVAAEREWRSLRETLAQALATALAGF